ncbi:non-ribosomal peptide synthetase, partial [Pseudomonas paralcaligenes]|uniref:non-ribosomal peptide synthetase n=1 Tax=Pseudomonas paralcaligenes TaxID=2772558 RepID=UPI0021D3759F
MNAEQTLKIARRFMELPSEKRRLFLEGLDAEGIDFSLLPIPACADSVERDGLSYAQQRMWFLWQLDPQGAAYNLPMAVRLNGELDGEALQCAFDALVARHETLRSLFSEQDGHVRQRVLEPFAVAIATDDLTALESSEREEQVCKRVDAEALAPFDLARGPLLRVQLLKLEEQEHVLLLTLHHIVADGWSYNVLIDEFIRLYDAACSGAEADLQPLPIQYRDYALWQRNWLEAGEQDRQLDYWRSKLGDDHAPLELPIDHPRPLSPSYRGARYEFQVAPALADRLRGLAREQGATLFMVLLSAFKLLLQRYSGQTSIRVGVPVANRNRTEVEGLIGCFINTQVLHTEIDPVIDVRELLQRVKDTALGAQSHQELPFERLIEALGLARSLSVSPLFQVMFNHQSQVADAGAIRGQSGLSLAALERETRIAQFDLSLDTYEKGSKLFAAFGYATDLFDSRTVEQMAGHYSNVLEVLAEGSHKQIGELMMLSDAQRQQILCDWNATRTDYSLDHPVHKLIETQVERALQATALEFGLQTLSYAQLNARSNRLAHRLIELGVGPDVLVGIAVERSIEMVVGLLAILKAGGAYVPLDPEYPAERLAYMLDDSGVRLLLSQSHLELPLAEGMQRIDLDQDDDWLKDYAESNPDVVLDGENLAYVIYTSGSTGKPKGAGNRHSALTNRLCWMQQAYGLSAGDCVLQKTPFSFDVSVWEFFWPLMAGARLVVAAPGDHRDPAKLIEVINRKGVTTLHFVPSMLQAFLQDEKVSTCTCLERIVCSGEALPVDAQRQVFARLPQARLYNLYGPTEAAIDVTHWTCVEEGRDAVPIGLPIANLGCHVLDDSLEPVPVGVLGELYLFGEGLARGYHQRSGLTAERFVASPFGNGIRMYRTGDLARYRVDGVIEYAGRIDHQVKLRGLRIELGEIEARLREHELVREVVVLAVDGKQLVGYVVLADAPGDWRDALVVHLTQHLPDYMVPAQWIDLVQMPLSPNGKLDRKALPRPDAQAAHAEYAAPQGELEQRIAAIWQDVLKRERVGRNDNFFELGGDSIVSIQVVSRARQAGIQFTPKDLFQHQTVRSLAGVAIVGVMIHQVDQGPVAGEADLTPVQRWFFELSMSRRHHWNQSLLLDARQSIEPGMLEQALRVVVSHHDALRLRFAFEAGEWCQWYAATDSDQDLLWQGEDGEVFYEEVQRSLDLASGPLLRAALLRRPDGGQRLLLAIHHLVVDGVSWRILLEDLQATYQRLATGQVPALPAKTSSYQAWAARLQEHGQAQQHEELADWLSRLDGPVQELPRDNPSGGLLNAQGAVLETRLDASYTERLLKQAPAAYRTQVNDLLLTALARVLCRWSGGDSVLVQMEGHGREDLFDDIDLNRTVGWFTSLYPVKLTPAAGLPDSLKAIKEQLRSVPDKGLGYGLLRYLGNPEARQALAVLPQPRVTFNYLGQFDGQFDAGTLFAPVGKGGGQAQADDSPLANWLSVEGQVYGGELSLRWGYSSEMYRRETIQRLADELVAELHAVIEHCTRANAYALTPSDFPLAKLTQAQLDALPVPARNIEDIYPLSPMQQGMLFHTLYEKVAGDYINQLRVDVGGLDAERFQAAWQATVAAHDILRTAFAWQGFEAPIQVVRQQVEVPFAVHDWRGQPRQAQELGILAKAERDQGFELSKAPLLRLVLVRTDERRHHLIYTSHHILMDGWSNAQLLGEVLQRYAGRAPQMPVGRYRDYIAWLQDQDEAASEAFWRSQLAGLTAPTRLTQAIRGEPNEGEGYDGHIQVLDREQTCRLSEFVRSQKVTMNTLLQGAWLLLLQRYTGQETVVFGATLAGRPAQLRDVEEQLGLFINTLPVIATPRADTRVAHWLQEVQDRNLGLREHEYTPLYEIQRWSGWGGEALFDSILVFENYPISEALQQGSSGELEFGAIANQEQTNYPLTLGVELGETLSIHYSYDREYFSRAAVEQIAGHFANLLEALRRQPDQCLGELPLLSQKEQQQMVCDWNRTEADYPSNQCIHHVIEAQAEKSPDATAVIFGEQELTYQQLNRRSNQLAHKLRELGVGPDVLVGVAVERGLEMVVGLLGILKAGGAYVPLDPEYPHERLAYMMEDSGIRLLLTQSHLQEQFPIPKTIQSLCLDQDGGWLERYSDANPDHFTVSGNLAYVMYTSGSTGRPKGVAISHDALSQHAHVSLGFFNLKADDRILQFATLNFDGFVEQLYPALICGACVVIRGKEIWDSDTFYRELLAKDISVVDLTTAYWFMLAKDFAAKGPRDYGRLHQVHSGGEAMPPEGVAAWKQAGLEHVHLLNTYGPTEATVTVSTHDCADYLSGKEQLPTLMPIGKVLPGRTIYLLDDSGQIVVQGAIGELVIGGELLARGYFKRSALTAERFIPDPFDSSEQGGGRLYRTGDLARYRADGVIEYVGRIDHQVKIRGFRIELGEIETRLQEHAAIGEAVVIDIEGPSGKQLAAYLVATDAGVPGNPEQQSTLRNDLREHLKTVLPDYMVPAHLMFLEKMPLTPNGKLDRKALPRPDAALLQGEYIAPGNEQEKQIAAIWAEVLKVERVGLTDHFFELGGHSLLAIQVISRVRQALNIDLPLRDLFEAPQLADFVARIEQGTGVSAPPLARVKRDKPLALSYAQQRQWFLWQLEPTSAAYHIPAALRLKGELDIEALRRSFEHLIERHETLRTCFRQDGEQAIQVIQP